MRRSLFLVLLVLAMAARLLGTLRGREPYDLKLIVPAPHEEELAGRGRTGCHAEPALCRIEAVHCQYLTRAGIQDRNKRGALLLSPAFPVARCPNWMKSLSVPARAI